jgi:hypothetical protein
MAEAGRPTLRRRVLAALAALAPRLLRPLLRLLQASLRVEIVGAEDLRARWARGERAILCFWHNRLLMLPLVAAGQPVAILVSHHRDGELAARLLAGWGIATVRGSATRGAVGGFLRLVHAYRQGHNLAVLPDGPRGPRCVAKPGVIHLARALGAPVYPMAYAADRVRRLRSWDRLLIPAPFARAVILVGAPLTVPAGASAEELEALRGEIERRLAAVTSAVEARAGMAAPRLEPSPGAPPPAAPDRSPP